eukprot:gene7514-9573_t
MTWGSAAEGGDSSEVIDLLVNVKTIVATQSAFAAWKMDGTAVTWGLSAQVHGCAAFRSGVNITQLVASEQAFAGVT